MDSLNGFVVFNQVAETRSFVAAGRLLGVSASAVGKSVARLEEKLGVRLFDRSTRSVSLTAEGLLFLERSRRILAEIEAAELELSQASAAPRGRLQADGRLRPVLVDHVQRGGVFHVLWPASKHPSPKVRALVDFLCARVFPAEPR